MEKWISVEESIANHLNDSMSRLHVKSIHGTSDPREIERQLNEFCIKYLGNKVAGCCFSYVSVGSTFIVMLQNGAMLVLKVYPGNSDMNMLISACSIQNSLSQDGFPCPGVIVPAVDCSGFRIAAMEYVDQGETVDGHSPGIRKQMAAALAELISRTKKYKGCLPQWLSTGNGLWPKPHNVLFDFSKEIPETKLVDEIGRNARSILEGAAVETIISHADWSIQNMAFRKGKLTAVFDWDSLKSGSEMFFVGASSHSFPYDWRGEDEPVPTNSEEIKSYIAEYEEAREKPFTKEELRLIYASMIYSMGYGARCKVSLFPERVDAVQRLIDFDREFLRAYNGFCQ